VSLASLDRVLPEYDVAERHSTRVVAEPVVALDAARAVTAAEAPMLRRLFRLRGLPVLDAPIWETMQSLGFGISGEDVLVAVGRPWLLGGGGLRRVEAPAAFDEPGYAVMAIAFEALNGLLVTETRVRLTNSVARRRFRAYWFVVRPFSGLVRRSWLAAARRRAEAG
jgi:hypothetical protein